MTALRVRILLLAFATGAVLGQSWTAHASVISHDTPDICAQLRNHVSLAQIEDELEMTGFSAAAAGHFTGETIKSQCPEMASQVESIA